MRVAGGALGEGGALLFADEVAGGALAYYSRQYRAAEGVTVDSIIGYSFTLMLLSLLATLQWSGFIYVATAAGLVVVVGLGIGFFASLFNSGYRGRNYPYE